MHNKNSAPIPPAQTFPASLLPLRPLLIPDVVRAFERASGRPVPYQLVGRRPGDVAQCYADAAQAVQRLGWRATRTLAQMCEDAWRWQSRNPTGYRAG